MNRQLADMDSRESSWESRRETERLDFVGMILESTIPANILKEFGPFSTYLVAVRQARMKLDHGRMSKRPHTSPTFS